MDDQAIEEVVAELASLLTGRAPGKIFQLNPVALVIDFRLPDHRCLLASVDPALPRIHLIKGRLRDLEKQSVPLGQFALALRKELSNMSLHSVVKDKADRIVRFHFAGRDELERLRRVTLVAQLSGRSANLLLLDPDDVITQQFRPTRVRGQQPGETYRPPQTTEGQHSRDRSDLLKLVQAGQFGSPSEAADAYFSSLVVQKAFDATATVARAELKKKISRHRKLLKQLENDFAGHANAEYHKRIGDLLLANLSTARRSGNLVTLIDYFNDQAPPIEVEIDEHLTLPEEASRRFALYSRSKRAVPQIRSRIETVKAELAELDSQEQTLRRIIEARDEAALEKLMGEKRPEGPSRKKAKREEKIPGTRRYLSSDGFEILVGRAARDNDYLTFKVARPNDLWLHAADYPGSHVILRNPTRKEIPHRTIIEAAQLAAYFSQANKDPKVDVHYTSRKFLLKPKGAAPGLVRMSRFKNITVEPRDSLRRA